MPLLSFPQDKYAEAVMVITDERRKFEPNISEQYVDKVLRNYVQLGLTHKIADYGKSWQINNQIIAAIQKAIGENDYNRVKNILDFMEIKAQAGLLFPSIARPNFAQSQFDAMLQAGHENDPTTGQVVAKGVHDFFGFAGSVVSDVTAPAISGLWSGLSTPVKIGVVGAGAVAVYLLVKTYL